ncbi:dextransucrase [Streptococcus gallolyticus]|uniref:dextransucrase n=1 Tax=Streptococcus gallolyticus TaxID=315405 RepID=A0A1H7UA42_9STRE|nr:glycoside hydrolase family 70 protein [Streptococcus gallolyticus]SEF19521.1 dextransucrase [Streptococcus gallolyticus]SEL93873.1 dextransucrase [Streptococcus gallolyticus]
MEKKMHYKLHKVKKQWVTIAVTTLVLVVGLGAATSTQVVTADETSAVTLTRGSDSPGASVDSSKTQAMDTTISNSDTVTEASTSTTGEDTSDDSQKVTDTTTAQGEQKTTKNTAEEVSQTSSTSTDETTTVSAEDEKSTKDPDTTTTTDASSDKVSDKTEETADADKENNSETETSDDKTKDALAEEVSHSAVSETGESTDQLSLDNIKKIDGKYYYVQADGSVKKNFAITVNGQLLYFDAETGALTSTSTYSFSEGLTNLVDNFSKNNQAYDSTEKSFELVDGYLTANSWYRPTKVLENGETWVDSTEQSFRPLVMAWWPDVDTQINYLNSMSEYFGLNKKYSASDSQASLNVAAEAIQVKIEQEIARRGSTEWLREVISSFVTTQDKWNMNSEDRDTDHLQGGALLYVNSDLTEWANSDYRLLNRAPTYQTGETKYYKADRTGGYDFLLANDVDNSNPVVQAEQLNQLYYLMNWGKIVFGDADANFDGVRVDAVDNVDADLLQIYTNLFEAAYGVDKTEAQALAHISILEAWSFNDPDYNHDTNGAALAIDNGLRMAFLDALTRPLDSRTNLESLIHNDLGMTDRTVDSAYGDTMPSYAFVRAHDSEVQGIIASIIAGQINPKTDGFTFTLDELQKAFEIYNADMNSVHKKYTHFNIPAAYALLLTNMESVPRVYYGDLFTDNGQYMAVKSPYYDQITALLKSRIKYAAGGQAMNVQYPDGAGAGILTSVRFGYGIMTADQKATDDSVTTSGIVTIVSNNPNLKLNSSDKIAVQVGLAHAGQYYRPLLSPTENGLQVFLNDSDTDITKLVDENGYIYFTGDEIKGFETVDMNGFLTVWVPVGAAADQDIRVKASTEAKKDGELTYETSAALDSQVIFEGFSNFQDFVQDPSQYTNKVIAENADLFASWGITSFELAPQYVSSTDGTFLDSIIQNGYAFTDRYDLAMSKNNKYGSAEDLRNAIKALHARGIQVIADWVPDQIYALPGEEIVTATRVNDYGEEREGAQIKNKPYAANTKSSGEDYQAQYGGEFLEYLQENYPELFEKVMISTGKTIDPSTKIKVWKAEYFNGTNILGKGADYVLNDAATGTYFTVTENGAFLPKQMTSDTAQTGFYYDGTGMTYYSTSGYQAKSSFVLYNGNRYYFDENGHMVTGMRDIDGQTYYFLPNGIELCDAIYEDANGNQYYFGKSGNRYAGHYYAFETTSTVDGVTKTTTNWRYFDENGVMARGLVKIGNDYQYYDDNGNQIKGQLVTDKDGNTRYFKADSGAMVTGEFALVNGDWYYFDENGVAVKGAQTINGQQLYFDDNGVQAKGVFVTNEDGTRSYYDAKSGEKFVGDFFTTGDNHWYYADENGNLATGSQVIRGQQLYFAADGLQAKGIFATDAEGNRHFYDPDSGDLAENKFIADGDDWYYFDETGHVVTGEQVINGQHLYFDENGVQAKGTFVTDANGNKRYYDAQTGEMVVNQTLTVDGVEYTFGADGVAVVNTQDSDKQSESTDDTQVTSDDTTVTKIETSSAE